MLEDVATSEQAVIGITENAARRIAKLIADEGRDNLVFRVAVSGGGCSGFQYGFSLDDQRNDDDRVFERDGVAVVIDEVSLDLLKDSEVDFVEVRLRVVVLRLKRGTSRCLPRIARRRNPRSGSPPGTSTPSRRGCRTCSHG